MHIPKWEGGVLSSMLKIDTQKVKIKIKIDFLYIFFTHPYVNIA
jgi:hypothetical protein